MHSKDGNSNDRQYRTSNSWIDDLPPCQNSGIAISVNKIFREDGSQTEEHNFEDRSFHCQLDDGIHLYGIFDGHMGPRAADFCLQRMPAEILLGQLIEKRNDEEIKDVLRQAFVSVERSYMDSIDELLAERASVQCDIPDGLNAYDAYQKYPHLFDKLKRINYQLSSGTSAAICLIHNNRLFVANTGTSRTLLCRTDANSVLKVVQLSVDHDLRNEDELLRLLQLGISTDSLRYGQQIGHQDSTRCLGDFLVKAGYREHRELRAAVSEPVIPAPDIAGGVGLDQHARFLVMMSRGVYSSLEEVVPSADVNKFLVQLIVEQVLSVAGLHQDVAQAPRAVLQNQDSTRCLGDFLVKAGYREHRELRAAVSEPVIPAPDIAGGVGLDQHARFLVMMSRGVYSSLEEVVPSADVNKFLVQLIVEQFRSQSNLNDIAQSVINKAISLHRDRILQSSSSHRKIEDMTLIIRNFNVPLVNHHPSSTNSSDMSNSTSNSYTTNSTNSSSTLEDIHNVGDNDRRLKPYVDFSVYYNNIRKQMN